MRALFVGCQPNVSDLMSVRRAEIKSDTFLSPISLESGNTSASMLRAGAMMLSHIGFPELGGKLDKAMDLCGQYDKELVMTGRDTGATTAEYGDYVLATVNDSSLDARWTAAIEAVRAGS